MTGYATPSSGNHLREIDGVLEELTRLSHSAPSFREFYEQATVILAPVVSAALQRVWMRNQHGDPVLVIEKVAPSDGTRRPIPPSNPPLVARLFQSGTLADSTPEDDLRGVPIRPLWIGEEIYQRVVVDSDVVAVVECGPEHHCDFDVRDGVEKLLEAVAEIAADFHRNHRLRRLYERDLYWTQLHEFCRAVYGNSNVEQTAYAIANEGRILIGCDRLILGTQVGEDVRLLAVSGVSTIEDRSELSRAVTDLTRVLLPLRERTWAPGTDICRLPPVESLVQDYLGRFGVHTICFVPLEPPENAEVLPVDRFGLLIEFFSAPDVKMPSLDERIDRVADHSSRGLYGALRLESIPFRRTLELVGGKSPRLRSRRKRLALLGVVLMAAMAAMIVVPAPFAVRAPAELQPSERRFIFAPRSGHVVQIHAREGQKVEQGQPLLELRNDDLDFLLTQVSGKIAATREALYEAQTENISSRSTRRSDAPGPPDHGNEAELQSLLSGLEAELKVLEKQREDLTLRSPLQGDVVTWDLTDLLSERPVQAGNTLMEVAFLEGAWEVLVYIPDADVGRVVQALDSHPAGLEAEFILETDPAVRYDGRLTSVSQTIERVDRHGPSAVGRLEIQDRISFRKPGAIATARIRVGWRPIGYVWFHDVVDFVRRRFLF
jgi:multidrug efflux pump subunit AcrA (membrane-fusion protein)